MSSNPTTRTTSDIGSKTQIFAALVIVNGQSRDIGSTANNVVQRLTGGVGNTNLGAIKDDLLAAFRAGTNNGGQRGFVDAMRQTNRYSETGIGDALDELSQACGTSRSGIPFDQLLELQQQVRALEIRTNDRLDLFGGRLDEVRRDLDDHITMTAQKFDEHGLKIASLKNRKQVPNVRMPWLAGFAVLVGIIIGMIFKFASGTQVHGVGKDSNTLIGMLNAHPNFTAIGAGIFGALLAEVLIVAFTIEFKTVSPQGDDQQAQQSTPAGTRS